MAHSWPEKKKTGTSWLGGVEGLEKLTPSWFGACHEASHLLPLQQETRRPRA
jgi:hypothetical protein